MGTYGGAALSADEALPLCRPLRISALAFPVDRLPRERVGLDLLLLPALCERLCLHVRLAALALTHLCAVLSVLEHVIFCHPRGTLLLLPLGCTA